MSFSLLCTARPETVRSLITIFLFLSILIQTFSWFFYDAAYVLNKDYIAGKLCVNKDKPAMHCNGKCFLAKQQQKEEQQNDKSADNRKEKFEIQFFSLPSAINLETVVFRNDIIYSNRVNFSLPEFYSSVFHPPSA